jgi:acyl-CoA thioester hydrolase
MPDPVPSPSFDHPITVAARDIDVNGHANNVVYVRWVQDAAVAHWFAAVEPELASSLTWAVVRHEIDYKRPAMAGNSLIARTWVGEVTAATCKRFCEITRPADGQVLARSRTIWCVFDPASGRPRRIDPRVRAAFGTD